MTEHTPSNEQTKHTPTPWTHWTLMVAGANGYRGGNGGICHCGGMGRSPQESEANAAFIVTAVNSHAMLLRLVDAQANDAGLWFVAEHASEAYLQQELRKLHLAIEGST